MRRILLVSVLLLASATTSKATAQEWQWNTPEDYNNLYQFTCSFAGEPTSEAFVRCMIDAWTQLDAAAEQMALNYIELWGQCTQLPPMGVDCNQFLAAFNTWAFGAAYAYLTYWYSQLPGPPIA